MTWQKIYESEQYLQRVYNDVVIKHKQGLYGEIAKDLGNILGGIEAEALVTLLSGGSASINKGAVRAVNEIVRGTDRKHDQGVEGANSRINTDPNIQVSDWDLENVYDYHTPLQLHIKKFDYFFGKVDSNDHNHYRSLQNQRQLNSIGIFDNEFGRSLLTESINKQIQNHSNIIGRREEINDGLKQIFETREMLLVGPNGVRMMVVDFEIMPNYSRRLATLIIKGGNL